MSKIEEQIEKAWKEHYESVVIPYVEKKVEYTADLLIRKAIQFRQELTASAHNFTGNLLNSIVALIYKDKQLKTVFYSTYYGVHKAIARKMGRPNHYHFKVDYEGDESEFSPEVNTDRGYGIEDAVRFAHEYVPDGHAKYDIVLAYPVEYAEFVEQARRTVGFGMTYAYFERNGWKFLHLPRDYNGANFTPYAKAPF